MSSEKEKELDIEPNPFLIRALAFIIVGLGLGYWGFFGFLGILRGAVSFDSMTLIFTVVPLILSPIFIYAGYCAWKIYKAGYTTKKLSDRRL